MNVALDLGHTPNYATVTIGDINLHFSYSTVIAFTTPEGTVARQNDWGTTTGKHLNRVEPDKSKRLDSAKFEAVLDKMLADRGLATPQQKKRCSVYLMPGMRCQGTVGHGGTHYNMEDNW